MTIFHEFGPGRYWTGKTMEAESPLSGWTAQEPPPLEEGQWARFVATGWIVTDQPPPEMAAVPEPAPESPRARLVITSVEADAGHADQSLIDGIHEATCPAGTTLTVYAELIGPDGEALPMSEAFRMPLRSRDGREKVLLATMETGQVTIHAPLRESGVWSVSEEAVNEGLPEAYRMDFDGFAVFVVEV
jgi:hypothetical protein